MAKNPADRILAAGKAIAEIFRNGELSLINLLAVFCGKGMKQPERQLRKLKNQRIRNKFQVQVNALLSDMLGKAQKEALNRLMDMHESTADEILAFAKQVEENASSALQETAEMILDEAQRAAAEADEDAKRMRRREVAEAYEDIARRAEALADSIETDLARAGQSAQQAVESLLNDLNQQWLESIKNMRRKADDVYRQVIEAERDNSMEGGGTIRKAVEEALQNFAEKGVTGFTDRANRNWGLAEYSEMAMRTAMQRANLLATIDSMLRTGQDLCYVNRHLGSCPVCMGWEAKILSLTGRTPSYMTLQQAMDSGLFHPNCAHVLLVYIEGVTRLDIGRPQDVSNLDSIRLFYDRQQQRYLERNVRKWKRKQAAATTPEYERYCQHQVEYWQKRIREHIKNNPELPRRYDREGGKVVLSAAAKGEIQVKTDPDLTPVIIESSKRDGDWRRLKDTEERRAQASARFLNKNDKLYEYAQNITPLKGYEDVVVHGDTYGFVFKDADGNESNVSAVEFANILKDSDLYKGGPIRLISCETGGQGSISAQALANELGVEVLAPSDIAYVSPDGEITIGHPLTNTGEWVRIKPKEG